MAGRRPRILPCGGLGRFVSKYSCAFLAFAYHGMVLLYALAVSVRFVLATPPRLTAQLGRTPSYKAICEPTAHR
jgi:hypothetical protein